MWRLSAMVSQALMLYFKESKAGKQWGWDKKLSIYYSKFGLVPYLSSSLYIDQYLN